MKYTNSENIIISSCSNNAINGELPIVNNNNHNSNTSINHVALVAGTPNTPQQLQNQQALSNSFNNNNNYMINNNYHKGNTTSNCSSIAGKTSPIPSLTTPSTTLSTTTATTTTTTALFCEQVTTVTNLFEKWNDCERTVVMYALLKRLRYPTLKFLQYSIDNNLSQNMGSHGTNLSTVVVDINANNASYLQSLLNAYKTFQPGDLLDTMSSSSSDKDSMPSCYGSDFQITTSAQCDERKLYARKEDILHEVLHMLPLLKPGNEEAKAIYMALIPVAVKDTMQQIVSTELVQQIFSYLLIHPAITSEDRRSLNVWLRHLEDHIQAAASGLTNQSYFLQPSPHLSAEHLSAASSTTSSTSSSSSAASCSSASNLSVASSSLGNLAINNCSASSTSSSSNTTRDWQTIAPPSKQHKLPLPPFGHDWSNGGSGTVGSGVVSGSSSNCSSHNGSINPLCDNLNGITLNELASSQNSLGLSIGAGLAESSSLVNGVAAAANVTANSNSTGGLFCNGNSSMISLIGGGSNNSNCNLNAGDDHDTSFSKNGTEIIDFEPSSLTSLDETSCDFVPVQSGYSSILMANLNDQFGDMNRWSLDSKIAALKTRRSNSLTTQTISSASSSSNSSVVTVNDNCSNSTENLAQFANKPRSYSLSIEHHQRGGVLMNSGSDTRLDEYKPNYIKFQTRNVGMSGIGLWLKSLRLHKYIELFKNMTYEEMLQITEEFLQTVGVTKGASHKLALCIEKLKERTNVLNKLEKDLLANQATMSAVVEELANIVLTPIKPIDSIPATSDEENIGMQFLRVVDLVSSALQKDPYNDEEALGIFMWILDRSIHNEAFVNHVIQIKDLKFKLSKLKMSIAPKMHHLKSGNNSNLSKPRWGAKNRKCDSKNGSNDRINHRKNSNDMLNFSLNSLSGHQHIQQQFSNGMDYNGYNNQSPHQYKSASYPSFIGNPQHGTTKNHAQPQQVPNVHQQQQQPSQPNVPQHIVMQQQHFPSLPQQTPQPQLHRRSLNNLIVISGGPHHAHKIILKPVIKPSNASNDTSMKLVDGGTPTSRSHQQRKQSLNGINNNGNNIINNNNNNITAPEKKSMAAVVMVSNNEEQHCGSNGGGGSILMHNNNNNNILNNNLISQQQLQLLAAAAAAVGNNLTAAAAVAAAAGNNCLCGSNSIRNNNNNNNNNDSNQCLVNNSQPHHSQQQQQQKQHQCCISSSNNCGNCCLTKATTPIYNNHNSNATPHTTTQFIANMNMSSSSISSTAPNTTASSLKDKYQGTSMATSVTALNAMNDYKSLEQLETLCLQMTEQAIN